MTGSGRMRFIAFLVSAGQFIARLGYEAIEDPNAGRVRGWLADLPELLI